MPDETPADQTAEENKLKAMQQSTQKTAMQIAKEAIAIMMSMGWRLDAVTEEYTDADGTKKLRPAMAFRSLTLAEWQEVQKERVRKQFLP